MAATIMLPWVLLLLTMHVSVVGMLTFCIPHLVKVRVGVRVPSCPPNGHVPCTLSHDMTLITNVGLVCPPVGHCLLLGWYGCADSKMATKWNHGVDL